MELARDVFALVVCISFAREMELKKWNGME